MREVMALVVVCFGFGLAGLMFAGAPINEGPGLAPGAFVLPSDAERIVVYRNGETILHVAAPWKQPTTICLGVPYPWTLGTDLGPGAVNIQDLGGGDLFLAFVDPVLSCLPPGIFSYEITAHIGRESKPIPGGILTVHKDGTRTFERGGSLKK